jgi:NADH-quinone oxidoreductase subunit H
VGVCLWELLIPAGVAVVVKYALAFGSVAFVLLVLVNVFRAPPMSAPRGQLPGAWDDRPTPLTASGEPRQ